MPTRSASGRRGILATLAALLALATMAVPARAQQRGVQAWVPFARVPGLLTGIQVQNLGGNGQNITVRWVHAGDEETQWVEAGQSANWLRSPGLADGAQIVANSKVAVTVNHVAGAGQGSKTAQGASPGFWGAGSGRLFLPILKRKASGANTQIALMNTQASPVDFKVTWLSRDGDDIGNVTGTIPAQDIDVIGPNTGAGIPAKDKGVYSARVDVTKGVGGGELVGAVIEQSGDVSDGTANVLGYGAIKQEQAGPTLKAPLIMANNFGGFTGLQVTNAGSGPANVKVVFGENGVPTPQAGRCGSLAERPFTLPAGGSKTLLQNGSGSANDGFDSQFATCKYVGSATITNDSTGQPLVGTVTQAMPGYGQSTYELTDARSFSSTADASLVQSHNYGIWSGLQVQNLGGDGATITVTFNPNPRDLKGVWFDDPADNGKPEDKGSVYFPPCPSVSSTPKPRTFTGVKADASVNILLDDVRDNVNVPCRYLSSATITSTGPVSAIVNQVAPEGSDRVSTTITGRW
jgi:hypothetical protein